MKTVFIHDIARPWKAIRKIECSIVEGKKFVWAEQGRRYLLGASAFFMETTAHRRRRSDLERIIRNHYIAHMHPGKWTLAEVAWRKEYA